MFTILGGDGKEYGPASADQIKRWIESGRANLDTKGKAVGTEEWKRLGDHVEFAPPANLPPTLEHLSHSTTSATPSHPSGSAVIPASAGARVGAAFINAFFYFLSFMPGSIIFAQRILKENPELARGGIPRPEDMNMELMLQAALWIYAGLAVAILIQSILIAWRGQNLGKLAVGARVVGLDGEPAGFARSVMLRFIAPVFFFLVLFQIFFPLAFIFLLADLCVMVFRDDQRSLHDLLAGTIVVKT